MKSKIAVTLARRLPPLCLALTLLTSCGHTTPRSPPLSSALIEETARDAGFFLVEEPLERKYRAERAETCSPAISVDDTVTTAALDPSSR